MRILVFAVCFILVIFFSASFQGSMSGLIANVVSLVFVCGGTLMATMISFPKNKIKNIFHICKQSYTVKEFDYVRTIEEVIGISREYKRSGFKALERAAAEADNHFFKIGLQHIADNLGWEVTRESIEKEFIFQSMEQDSSERIMRSMARYAPSFGLAGTIIGLMMIFPQLSTPDKIGPSMSLALMTTLYGVLASNLLLLPLANKLRDKISDDEIMLRFIIEALHCIEQKEYSVVIDQRLSSLMPRAELVRYQQIRANMNHLRIAENA